MTAQITPRFIKTPDAMVYLAVGRTRFYTIAGRLGIKPAYASGNTSLWRRADVEKMGDFLEGNLTDAAA